IGSTTYTFGLTLLALKEDHTWVLQCLEHDIAAQGPSTEEAENAFERTFAGQVLLDLEAKKKPLEDVPKAPQHYWEMFRNAKRLDETFPLYIPDVPADKDMPAWMINAVAREMRVA